MTALLYPGMIAAAPAPTEPPIGNASFGPVGQQAAAPTSPAPVPTPAPAAPAAPSVPSWGGSATVGSGTPSPAPAPTSNTGMIGVSPAPTSPPVGAPAPATPAVNGGDWAKEVAGLNWAAGEGARSTANLWAIKNSYNLSDDQLATAIKDANGQQLWTGAQLGQHFQRFGYGTTGPSPGVTGEKGQDGRITDSPMDFSNETIQGRLGQVLATDDKGNYTNPVIRQAVDRQMQAFNARGLRNSSMALQAAQEAAISKAIEIVGPDAERYFQNRQNNVRAGNDFAMKERDIAGQSQLSEQQFQQNLRLKDADYANNEAERQYKLRADYLGANDRAMERYNSTVNNINASQMTPADKTVAIQQAAAVRDSDLTYVNNMFAAQPGWQKEWLTIAVPTGDTSIEAISNIDTLANIANDPAQPFERRAAAKARMQQLLNSQGTAPAPAPAPAGSGLITADFGGSGA